MGWSSIVQPLETRVQRDGRLGPQAMAIVLLTLMLGAFITDRVGIYAVFGAFTIMVPMAIITTLMASPLFEQIYGRRLEIADERVA